MARKATGRKAPGRKAAGKKAAPAEPKKKAAAAATTAKRKAAPATTRKAATKKAAPARKATAKATRKSAPKAAVKAAARKAAPKKAAARKAAPKATAVKKATPKKVARKAAVAPAVRRKVAAKRTPVARKASAPRLKTAAPMQVFTINHLNETDFKRDGLRPYALYRDLGIAAATGGLCQAHVIRMIPPCTDEVRKRHTHAVELQLVYVLKGWIKNELEGHGEQMMSQGTCWLQPPGIKHTVLDYSADFEGLEIIIPADFGTTEVA